MRKQGSNDRMDESLGMRRGKESTKSQNYADRRAESRGASRSGGYDTTSDYRKVFDIKDNAQAPTVKYVDSDAEGYDMKRVQVLPISPGGQLPEAWNYKY